MSWFRKKKTLEQSESESVYANDSDCPIITFTPESKQATNENEENDDWLKGYKVLSKDMLSPQFKFPYELGQTYTEKEKNFYAFTKLSPCFKMGDLLQDPQWRYFEVSIWGDVTQLPLAEITNSLEIKGHVITIEKEVPEEEIYQTYCQYTNSHKMDYETFCTYRKQNLPYDEFYIQQAVKDVKDIFPEEMAVYCFSLLKGYNNYIDKLKNFIFALEEVPYVLTNYQKIYLTLKEAHSYSNIVFSYFYNFQRS